MRGGKFEYECFCHGFKNLIGLVGSTGTWPLIGLIKIDDLTIKIISSTSKNQELDIFPIIWLVLFLNHGFLKNKRMCLPIILQECTNVKKINKWVFFFLCYR